MKRRTKAEAIQMRDEIVKLLKETSYRGDTVSSFVTEETFEEDGHVSSDYNRVTTYLTFSDKKLASRVVEFVANKVATEWFPDEHEMYFHEHFVLDKVKCVDHVQIEISVFYWTGSRYPGSDADVSATTIKL